MLPKLSIVIPVFNKLNFTRACIEDLSRLDDDHEIIIIDNASQDGTEQYLKDLKDFCSVKHYRMDTNSGFGKACNVGYSMSRSDNVLFLNNDIRVKSNHYNWTEPLIKEINEHSFKLAGPTLGHLDKKLEFLREDDKRGNPETELDYLSGWCLAGSKGTFEDLILPDCDGPFSQNEFFCYFEDTDLSFRAKRLDIELKLVPVPVHHFGKVTSRSVNMTDLYTASRKTFHEKWLGKV